MKWIKHCVYSFIKKIYYSISHPREKTFYNEVIIFFTERNKEITEKNKNFRTYFILIC